MALLEVRNLQIFFKLKNGREKTVLKNISFDLDRGEVLGVVGESGSGKTLTALAVIGELPHNAVIAGGEISYDGQNLFALSAGQMRKIKGKEIGMIFQNPATALNPIMTVGRQLKEMLDKVGWRGDKDARVHEVLQSVEIHDPKLRAKHYPFTMSGGMQQRVDIAMATILAPGILIADEPTTALDVTTQAAILELIKGLARKSNIGVMLITHNLGIIAEYADRVIVLDEGNIVEENDTDNLFKNPAHSYTRALLGAVPRIDLPSKIGGRDFSEEGRQEPILEVSDLRVHRPITRNVVGPIQKTIALVRAVDGVTFVVNRNEAVGIVGETGCGKTTLAEAILGFVPVTSGDITLEGKNIVALSDKKKRAIRGQKIGLVFQESAEALDPQKSIMDSLCEGFVIHKLFLRQKEQKARELMELVGLEAEFLWRRPPELSSGQRQRVCIARALALEPEILILDEPVASLDVLVQSKIIDLLIELREKTTVSFVFISHDIAVVKDICDRILVMYVGKIMEEGPAEKLIQYPAHPYTKALVSSVPIPDPVVARSRERVRLPGEVPSSVNPPTGCRFRTRCQKAGPECQGKEPFLEQKQSGHLAACHKVK